MNSKLSARSYELARPTYPRQVYDYLKSVGIVEPRTVVADIGAGTGRMTSVFAGQNHQVIAIEPSPAMFSVLSENFKEARNVALLNEKLESCSISPNSVDVAIAAQSLHYFATQEAKSKIEKILTPNGTFVVTYYSWSPQSAVGNEVRDLFRRFQANASRPEIYPTQLPELKSLFTDWEITHTELDPIHQIHSETTFLESMRSSSCAPDSNSDCLPDYATKAAEIFFRHSCNGTVEYSFEFSVYIITPKSL